MEPVPQRAESLPGRETDLDFSALVEARKSIRAYEPRPVEREKLEAILEAARLAPSAGNLQAYEIVVVDSPEARRALAAAALGQAFLERTPIILAFCADPARNRGEYGERGATLYSVQDAAIAATHAVLAATALGLGSCWVGAFDETAVAQAIGAPEGIRPVSLIAIGYAAENPERPQRRQMSDLVRRGSFFGNRSGP